MKGTDDKTSADSQVRLSVQRQHTAKRVKLRYRLAMLTVSDFERGFCLKARRLHVY